MTRYILIILAPLALGGCVADVASLIIGDALATTGGWVSAASAAAHAPQPDKFAP